MVGNLPTFLLLYNLYSVYLHKNRQIQLSFICKFDILLIVIDGFHKTGQIKKICYNKQPNKKF